MVEETTIERVRLQGDALDPTIARLRLGNLLAGSELRPPGLAPSAMLCVRRVIDPMPGTLQLGSAESRPPPAWERAFVEALEQALRTAARPAREAVPAGAEAVLFADRAELLACLARDARDGTAWTRWWWRSLRAGTAPGADPVVEAWLAAPEHVPAALELLAFRHEAAAFVSALPLAAAATLADRVATAFGATELRRAIVAAGAQSPRSTPAGDPAPRPSPEPERPVELEPPWRSIVPETSERRLGRGRELLLGVALALRRSPAVARSPSFAVSARAWLLGAPPRRSAARPSTSSRPYDARAEEARPAGSAPSPEKPVPAPLFDPRTPDESIAVGTPRPKDAWARAGLRARASVREQNARLPAPPEGAAASRPVRETGEPGERHAPRPGAKAPPARATPSRPRRAPARPRSRPRAAEAEPALVATDAGPEPVEEEASAVVETALGGVFYLLNLALHLGLYSDFTRPLDRGIALDPWDFLRLVGRRLVGSDGGGDTIWPLLVRLAGPRTFRPPRAWRTPRSWLEPFENDGPWLWSTARGTLRVEHPWGFTALAVPLTGIRPQEQLDRELRRLGVRPQLRRAQLAREPAHPVDRWAARFAAYAAARIRLAVGLTKSEPVDRVVLRHHARVFVTASHLDVVFRLADLPLEVRFAGLDRTPGWIPAAGRYVTFHFE